MRLRRVRQHYLSLDRQGTLFSQLYRALKDAILSGQLAAGTRLPSTRTLAEELGLSRSTTVVVYDQLLAEGFLSARHGAGTFVAREIVRPKIARKVAKKRPLPS